MVLPLAASSGWFLGTNMSFSFIGPWLLALWARAEEAGRSGTVNEHLERVCPTLGRVAQLVLLYPL